VADPDQARRQDIAEGGAKNQKEGPKPEGGPHFKNRIQTRLVARI